jgi:two-component system response regulator VanR
VKKKRAAIENGADIYVLLNGDGTDIQETVTAVVRRYIEYKTQDKSAGVPVAAHGGISMDLDTRRVFIAANEVSLAKKEFDILRYILERRGSILTYDELYTLVWGDKHEQHSANALIQHVHRLKEKIRINNDIPDYILNVREIGYRLNMELV